ncbi:MAG: hypothetical protein FGM58_11190 [Acidimicrobiia bacterium]|nr:hypothetical protein [Acidimicrobiia bacterium]
MVQFGDRNLKFGVLVTIGALALGAASVAGAIATGVLAPDADTTRESMDVPVGTVDRLEPATTDGNADTTTTSSLPAIERRPCPTGPGQLCDPGRPRIVSMEPVTDLVFDSSRGPHTVAFRVHVVSPGYEFRPTESKCDLQGQWPLAYFSMTFDESPVSGDRNDGIWILSETFPRNVPSFRWTIEQCDFRGEWPLSWSQSAGPLSPFLAAEGWVPLPGRFVVQQTDPGDTTAPTAHGSVSTTHVDVSASSRAIVFTTTLSDDRSGVTGDCSARSPDGRYGFAGRDFSPRDEFLPHRTMVIEVHIPWNTPVHEAVLVCDLIDGAGNHATVEAAPPVSITFTPPTVTMFQFTQIGRWGGNTVALRGAASITGPMEDWAVACNYRGATTLTVDARNGIIESASGGDFPPGLYSLTDGCWISQRVLDPFSNGAILIPTAELPSTVQRTIEIY